MGRATETRANMARISMTFATASLTIMRFVSRELEKIKVGEDERKVNSSEPALGV